MRFSPRMFAAVGLITVSAIVAHASPITYTVSGVASGSLGGSSFTDALVTITMTSDTTTVTPYEPSLPSNTGTTTVSVAGIGDGTLTNTLYVLDVTASPSSAAGFEDLTTDFVFAVLDTGFAGYSLGTSFGPLTGVADATHGITTPTTEGELEIDATSGDFTFTAVEPPAATPEPSSFALLGTGVLGLAGVARRKLFA
jgi:hypothetical protein